MSESKLRDWREFPAVKQAQAEHREAAAALAALEAQQREVVAALRVAEAERERADNALMAGNGTMGDANKARHAAMVAQRSADELSEHYEPVYARLVAAEQALKDATIQARRETWPAYVAAYRGAAVELDKVLAQVLEREEAVSDLHRRMSALFESPSGGWIVSPVDGERVGVAAWGTRPLRRESYTSWRSHLGEHILA